MTVYREERQHLIDCARKMERYGLVVLSGGNVSMRMPDGNFLVTPSAMGYDNMQPEDIVLIDASGRTLDGIRRPSSDSAALLYIFNHRPDINVVLHTHQPYATALGLVCDQLPADFVTVIDELNGAVAVAPFTRSSDEGMGQLTVQYAGSARAVILKHHGAMAFGKNIDQALSAAVYLEDACKSYLAALATGREIAKLTADQIADESHERGYYGQPED